MLKTKLFYLILIILISINGISAKIILENGKYYVEQDLKEQWNLIAGISFSDELNSNSELNLDSIFKSYYYDAKTKKNIEIRPEYQANEQEPLVLYRNAFWVFSAIPGKIIYKVSPSFVNKSKLLGYYQFYSGDNLIGINDEIYGKKLNEIKGDCEIAEANFWDAKKQNWTEISLDEELIFESRESLVGKGINIKVREDCQFFNKNIIKPDYDCSDWSECQRIYNINDIINNNIILQGERKRYCINTKTFIVSSEMKICEINRSVFLKKIKEAYGEILQIFDENKYFISNISLIDNRMDIKFPVQENRINNEISQEFESFEDKIISKSENGRFKNFLYKAYCAITNFFNKNKYKQCLSRFIF